jgi:hypothetical protein
MMLFPIDSNQILPFAKIVDLEAKLGMEEIVIRRLLYGHVRRFETQSVLAVTAGVSIDNADAVRRIVDEPWDELYSGHLAGVIITLDTMLNVLLTRERIFILHSSSDQSHLAN